MGDALLVRLGANRVRNGILSAIYVLQRELVVGKAANMQRSIRLLIVMVVNIVLGLTTGISRDVVEVESRYLGDGWFQYGLRTLPDPFIIEIGFANLVPYPFTNYVLSIAPPHWTNYFSKEEWWGIAHDQSGPQPRLNEINFSVRSSLTHFKQQPHGFETFFAVILADCFRSTYIAGYVNLPCLIPCAPGEADGSPPQLVARFELIPDLIINRLILTNGEVHGLTFSGVSIETVE